MSQTAPGWQQALSGDLPNGETMPEDAEEATVTVSLPPEVDDWIDRQASRRDEPREAVCRRLLAAASAVATDDDLEEPADRADLEELDGRLEAQREEFVDLLEDVRDRVVQVKREADAKAPADHDHSEYARGDSVDELAGRVDGIGVALDDLEETVTSGFDNYETVVEQLVDETDRLADRSAVLARTVLDLRVDVRERAARERRREVVAELKLAANRLGVRRADCEDCGTPVEISLLDRPECPHCASAFVDVRRGPRFLGSNTLETGDPPALEAPPEPTIGDDSSPLEELRSSAGGDASDGSTDPETDDVRTDRSHDSPSEEP